MPDYNEAQNYVAAPAVRDRGLITASGLGNIEFARELFEELNVLSSGDRAGWAQDVSHSPVAERRRSLTKRSSQPLTGAKIYT